MIATHPRRTALISLALACLMTLVAGAEPGTATKPKPRNISYYYDGFDQGLVRPLARAADPARLVRKLAGNPREACNVDARDQVQLPSSWWQPRLGFRPVSPQQMLDGPGRGTGPAPGKFLITRMKTQGVSPGFQIKDSRGAKYGIKFDPPGHPELASGADVVSSYLYWAAGYNVPHNSIVFFRREDLVIAPGATYSDAAGQKRPLSAEMADKILTRAQKSADGTYRAVASRWMPGEPIGEWEYSGVRGDDAEDQIPHELRREIRGLWGLYAWTNDTDCSARNTFDTWVTEGGRSFVRHYLIDFSGSLGSASIGPQTYRGGFEYLMDNKAAAVSLLTLGLKPPRWEHVVDPKIPSVGFIESERFDPASWKPFLPNPAFDDRTRRDVQWSARIIAAFTDEHIRAAVEAGRYSDPRATEYLTRVLIERRDKIVRHWLGPIQSLDASR